MSHLALAIALAAFCAAFGYWPLIAHAFKDSRDPKQPTADVHYDADGNSHVHALRSEHVVEADS